MAGFGKAKKEKSPKGSLETESKEKSIREKGKSKVKPSSKKDKEKSKDPNNKTKKVYKIGDVSEDSYVEDNSIEKLTQEIINIPSFCDAPDTSRELDLFIIHVFKHASDSDFIPYFFGNYSMESYDMYISNSTSSAIAPSDIVDSDDSVINLRKRR